MVVLTLESLQSKQVRRLGGEKAAEEESLTRLSDRVGNKIQV